MPAKKTAVPTEDRVREIAHQLWLEAGQPEGQHTDHWLKAEELARQELAKPAARKAPAKAAAPAAPKKAKPTAGKAPAKKVTAARKD